MKIFEVLDDHQSGQYHQRLQSKVLDYLTTVVGMEVDSINVQQLVTAFRKRGVDIRADQIDEILTGTGFSVEGDKVVVATSDEMDTPEFDPTADTAGGKPPSDDDMTDMKVQNMASNQMAKDRE